VRAREREGFRPSAQCAHDKEVCGSVRGGASSVERRTNLCSGRPVRARELLRRHVVARLVSSCHPRKGAAEGKGGEESSSLTAAYEESMRSR